MQLLSKSALMSRIVYLHYREDLTIQDISERLEISRFRVSRYLREARETGLVTIQINDRDTLHCDLLASKLEERFAIGRVIVVPSRQDEDSEALRVRVGEAGARILQNLSSGMSVGITLGRTVANMVGNIVNPTSRLAYVSELTGGLGLVLCEYPSGALASMFAKKFSSFCYQLSAPIIVSDPEIAQSLLKDSSVAKTLEMSRRCDVAVCGVTPFTQDSMLFRSGVVTEKDFERFESLKGVGSIIGRFFDAEGRELDTEFRDRAISVRTEEFLRIPQRIILAGGLHKAQAIRGILLGGLATTIVLDDKTAAELIKS